jgi:hypothetical protein
LRLASVVFALAEVSETGWVASVAAFAAKGRSTVTITKKMRSLRKEIMATLSLLKFGTEI